MKSPLITPTQICPNLQPHWQLEHRENINQWVLQAGDIQHPLTPETAYILQHFVGNLTIAQIQAECGD